MVGFVRGNLAAGLSAALSPVKGLIRSTLGEGGDWKGWLGRLGLKPMDQLVEWVRGKDDATAAIAGPAASAPTGVIQQYAKGLLDARGWGAQWGSFNALVMGESGWNPMARNPSSGAFGIPQALPASKLDAYGNRNDYRVQLRWMLDYIAGRADYRTPAGAYSKWLSRSPHWYDQGGPLHPGWTMAYNGTGKDEWVSKEKPSGGVTIAAGAIQQTIHADGAIDAQTIRGMVEQGNIGLLDTLDQMLQQGEGVI
ncbi:hypothetical protein FRAHR75_230001 [Frankia sp. Hr75.2]|nr:hypothetical protein FRAHR75_230001 [Frankia sp. Hr75.2]